MIKGEGGKGNPWNQLQASGPATSWWRPIINLAPSGANKMARLMTFHVISSFDTIEILIIPHSRYPAHFIQEEDQLGIGCHLSKQYPGRTLHHGSLRHLRENHGPSVFPTESTNFAP